MGQPTPERPKSNGYGTGPAAPRVGRVSEFVGSRLLMIWILTGLVGLGLLVFAGIKLWLVVTRGRLGADLVPLVVFGMLSFALLSISGSARRMGLKFLRGERAVSSDLARFAARRIERRRQRRRG